MEKYIFCENSQKFIINSIDSMSKWSQIYFGKRKIESCLWLNSCLRKVKSKPEFCTTKKPKLISNQGNILAKWNTWISNAWNACHQKSTENQKSLKYQYSTKTYWQIHSNGKVSSSLQIGKQLYILLNITNRSVGKK